MILLFDLMDTLLTDPFFPVIDRMCPDPQQRKIWSESRTPGVFEAFESGLISEADYFRTFYKDSARQKWWHVQKIKKYMFRSVSFVPGMESVFHYWLNHNVIQVGIASNYSQWYQDVLRLRPELLKADYLFFSCEMGFRKPMSEFFTMIQEALSVLPHHIVFVDDRLENVEAARKKGWNSIHFSTMTAEELQQELLTRIV